MRNIETINVRVIGAAGLLADGIVDIKHVPRQGERILVDGKDLGVAQEVYWDNTTARRTAYVSL